MTVEHPTKVDASIDPAGEVNDLAIIAKALSDGQNASE
jgi:hypothetical protein